MTEAGSSTWMSLPVYTKPFLFIHPNLYKANQIMMEGFCPRRCFSRQKRVCQLRSDCWNDPLVTLGVTNQAMPSLGSWSENGVPGVLRAGPSDRHPCSQLRGGSTRLHCLPGGPPSACFHQGPCHVLCHPDSTHVPGGSADRWEGFCRREWFPWLLLQTLWCLQGVQVLCAAGLGGKITFL